MKFIRVICLPSVLMFLAHAANSQALTGSSANITMTSNSLPGFKVTSPVPPPNQSPVSVNLIEGWAGGSTFIVGVPPPKLVFTVNNYGNVGISNSLRIGATAANGTYANYKLSVDGDMIAKKCVIQVTNWADYVFEDNYSLPSLSEVESYINENKHLPGVPSEKEVLSNGVEIGKVNEILLKKIEELTLYTIMLQKEVEALKNNNGNCSSNQ